MIHFFCRLFLFFSHVLAKTWWQLSLTESTDRRRLLLRQSYSNKAEIEQASHVSESNKPSALSGSQSSQNLLASGSGSGVEMGIEKVMQNQHKKDIFQKFLGMHFLFSALRAFF
jgi:hypothetical protein